MRRMEVFCGRVKKRWMSFRICKEWKSSEEIWVKKIDSENQARCQGIWS
jgi:hypothetical protein